MIIAVATVRADEDRARLRLPDRRRRHVIDPPEGGIDRAFETAWRLRHAARGRKVSFEHEAVARQSLIARQRLVSHRPRGAVEPSGPRLLHGLRIDTRRAKERWIEHIRPADHEDGPRALLRQRAGELEVDRTARHDRHMRGDRRGGADRLAIGRRRDDFRPHAFGREGESAGRRYREIGHARDSRDARQFYLGGVEQQETLGAGNGGQRIARRIARHRHQRFDLDAIEPRTHGAQRQRNGILREDVASRFRQLHADRVAAVHADDDMRLGREAGRIAARQIDDRLAIVGRIEVRRQNDVESGAEQAAGELLAGDAEIAQLHALTALDMQSRERGGRAKTGWRADWLLARVEFSESLADLRIGRAGDDDGRAQARIGGNDEDARTRNRTSGAQVDEARYVAGRTDDEIDAIFAVRERADVDHRLLEAAMQRDELRGAHDALDIGEIGAARHDGADRQSALRVRRERRQVRKARNRRRARQQQTGLRRVDLRPQFVGRLQRAIDAMALLGGQADRVEARLQRIQRNIEGNCLDRMRGANVGAPDDDIVDGQRQIGRLRHDGNGRKIAHLELDRQPRLFGRDVDGPFRRRDFAGKSEALNIVRQMAQRQAGRGRNARRDRWRRELRRGLGLDWGGRRRGRGRLRARERVCGWRRRRQSRRRAPNRRGRRRSGRRRFGRSLRCLRGDWSTRRGLDDRRAMDRLRRSSRRRRRARTIRNDPRQARRRGREDRLRETRVRLRRQKGGHQRENVDASTHACSDDPCQADCLTCAAASAAGCCAALPMAAKRRNQESDVLGGASAAAISFFSFSRFNK